MLNIIIFENMLNLKNITKSFGEQKVLIGLNLHFEKGKIHTIVGGNGAGKTTLLNIITGYLKPEEGKILYNEQKINLKNPQEINTKGISRTFQDLRLAPNLTVRENLLLAYKNNSSENVLKAFLPRKYFKTELESFNTKTDKLLQKINLIAISELLASEISYGQQKLLTLGCCLANDAELLILDEPIAGIDKQNYEIIHQLILDLKNEGKTIIQIEHNLEYIEKMSDSISLLYNGTAIAFSNYTEFIKNEIVQKHYLN
jgi:branched-chain amino acid transport system ATP-binding protein